MDAEQWSRIESVVAAALELPDDQRGAFLDEACGDDADLFAEVEGLLAGRTAAENLLEGVSVSPFAEVASEAPDSDDPMIGFVVGPYEIDRVLGEGGMGVVYLARRIDEEFEQQVAIKLLHRGPAGEAIRSRFLTERQILAALDHPNIAHLLDGGSIEEDGRPYLVMEFVGGLPLDVYCRDRAIGVDERIDLFLEVCDAVGFAHRNLVVHRDLKPSNILVDAEGRPKLLDFGIAKLLDPATFPMAGETTGTGLRPMSPQFASPEQIRGQPITTASDVYSLGVILYQLLTGETPRRFDDYSLAAMERELGREPAAPSAAVPDEPAAQRTRRRLVGDLDAIVLKALREEPGQRYGSVAELVDDLRRHLDGEPVAARQGTLAYRAGRFLRRHRTGVAISTLLGALIVGFTATLAVQQKRTALERDKAQQVAEFMVSIFEETSPAISGDGNISAREVVERAVNRVERDFVDQPGIQAELLLALGRIYNDFGLYRQALPLLRKSLQIQEGVEDRADPSQIVLLTELGSVETELGEFDDAQIHLDRAVALGQTTRGGFPKQFAAAYSRLGHLYDLRSEYDEAIANHRHAVEECLRGFGPESVECVFYLGELGWVLAAAGEHEEAGVVHELAVDIAEKSGDQVAIGHALSQAGILYWRTDRLELAARYLKHALEIYEEIHHPGDPIVGNTMNNLATVYRDRAELDKAEHFFRRSLAAKQLGMGDRSPPVLITQHNLASTIAGQGRIVEARNEWLEIMTGCRELYPDGNQFLAVVLRSLARVELFAGLNEEAERHDRESLEMLEEYLEPLHPTLLNGYSAAACLDASLGRLESAESRLRTLFDAIEDPSSLKAVRRVVDRCRMAEMMLAAGRVDEAAVELGHARQILNNHGGAGQSVRMDQYEARYRIVFGDLLRHQNRWSEAQSTWEESLDILDRVPGAAGQAEHRLLRIAALLRLDRSDEARLIAKKLVDLGWKRPAWIPVAADPNATLDKVPVALDW